MASVIRMMIIKSTFTDMLPDNFWKKNTDRHIKYGYSIMGRGMGG
jgi:hypothetical protein